MGGKSGGGGTQISEYYLSIHMGICLGPVALTGIYVGEKAAWTGEALTEQTIAINQPNLHGGRKKEGGAVGEVHFKHGTNPGEGSMPENLALRLGRTSATCPAFNGIASLFFVGKVSEPTGGFLWSANSPYLKAVWARVRRRPDTFEAADGEATNYSDLGTEANPAHMIYECLTNTEWGMGTSPDGIDTASFQACAKTFSQEGFGLSMLWTQQSTIEAFVTEILDHVQATVFVNPLTGLITIKAIRDDYDADSLDVLDETNCRVTKFERKAWGETINEINITWTNPENEQEETVTMHDLANIEMQGGIVSETRNYYGIRSVELATRVAARDIRSAAAPLATFEIEANRNFWGVLPGGVIKLDWPEEGIQGLVLRILDVDYGRPGDSTIRLSTIEDIFGLPQSAYFTPGDSEWLGEAQEPTPLDDVEIMTLPTYFAVRVLSDYGAATLTYPETVCGVLGGSTNMDTRTFDLYGEQVNTLGEIVMVNLGTKPITARCTTLIDIDQEIETTISGTDLGLDSLSAGEPPQAGQFAILSSGPDSEREIALIASVSLDFSSVTLLRGVLDTVPKAWPAGTRVWFPNSLMTWGEKSIFSDEQEVEFQMTPTTSLGTLPLEESAVYTRTLSGRPNLPTRPGNVTINGTAFGKITLLDSSDIDVEWANRNRLTEDAQIVLWDDGDVTPEDGQTTKITVMTTGRAVLTEHTGLTGTSFALPYASLDAEDAVIIRVTAERDGLESLQGHEFRVNTTGGVGWGFDYGNDWGG